MNNKICVNKAFLFSIFIIIFLVGFVFLLTKTLSQKTSYKSEAATKKQRNILCPEVQSCNKKENGLKVSLTILNQNQCNTTCEEIGIDGGNDPSNNYKKCFDKDTTTIRCFYNNKKPNYPNFTDYNSYLITPLIETINNNAENIPYCMTAESLYAFVYSNKPMFDFFRNGQYLLGSQIEFNYGDIDYIQKLNNNSEYYNSRGDKIPCNVFNTAFRIPNPIAYSCWVANYLTDDIVFTRMCNVDMYRPGSVYPNDDNGIEKFHNEVKDYRLRTEGINSRIPLSCQDIFNMIGKEFSCPDDIIINSNGLDPDPYNNLIIQAQKQCNLKNYQGVACAQKSNIESNNLTNIKFSCCDTSPYFIVFN